MKSAQFHKRLFAFGWLGCSYYWNESKQGGVFLKFEEDLQVMPYSNPASSYINMSPVPETSSNRWVTPNTA